MTPTKQSLKEKIERVLELDAKRTPGDYYCDGGGIFIKGIQQPILTGDDVYDTKLAIERGQQWGGVTWHAEDDKDLDFISEVPTMVSIIKEQQEIIERLVKALKTCDVGSDNNGEWYNYYDAEEVDDALAFYQQRMEDE